MAPTPQVQTEAILDERAKAVLGKFSLSHDDLIKAKKRFEQCIEFGLSSNNKHKCSLAMLPSYVRDTPDGTECGDFIALDLGGTNFRVLHVRLSDAHNQGVDMDSQVYKLEKALMVGAGVELFDFIAKCLDEFIEQFGLTGKKMSLGFTFSFPCHQSDLNNGVLVNWTKGFNASGVVGNDVVEMLQEAIDRQNGDYELHVVAIVNDTVGTLISCAYDDHDCVIGLIVGTGTNASYMEEASTMEWFHEENGRMCINLEWGGYGDKGELEVERNQYDRKIDEGSINPGSQLYEKMISGMYMGELVRLAIVDLVESKILFGGVLSDKLKTQGSFETAFVTQIDSDDSPKLKLCSQILHHMGYIDEDDPMSDQESDVADMIHCSMDDKHLVSCVCHAISSRAAHLSACGVAALLTHIDKNNAKKGHVQKRLVVGVDGTVYKKHDKFRELQQCKVRELMDINSEIEFKLSHDGSGKGAALISAIAYRLAN